MQKYLDGDIWNRFLDTYANDTACELVRRWGHTYNLKEAEAGYKFLKHVQTLPKEAKEIF